MNLILRMLKGSRAWKKNYTFWYAGEGKVKLLNFSNSDPNAINANII